MFCPSVDHSRKAQSYAFCASLWLIHYCKSRHIQTALEHRGRFHSDDAVRSLSKAVRDVSQNPKRRAKKSLAVVVRSTTLSMPSFVARLAFGEMADALLLSSAKVEPKRLLDTGYRFEFERLQPALESILKT